MKSWLLLFSAYSFLTALSCGPTLSNTPKEINFMNSQIVFASLDESKDLLGTSDEFTKSLSPFDCASKTQNTENKQESDYLEFAKNQALQWTAKDIVNTTKIIEETIHQIQKLQLEIPLPEKIILVKSTCLEEGGASGYTRGSFIVLNSAPDIHLFIHELFHVFSRHNPEIRERLYATIGFKPCNKIDYPK